MHYSNFALSLCLALLACSVAAQPMPSVQEPFSDNSTDLISTGNLTATWWVSTDCTTQRLMTFVLKANYSLCQSAEVLGQTAYFRADCYTNDSSKISVCHSGCEDCSDEPSAPSGTCARSYGVNLASSYMTICPTIPVPEDSPASNSTNSPTPQSDPTSPESAPIAPVTTPDTSVPSMTPESVPQLVPESPAPAPSSASFASLSLLVIAFMLLGAIHSI